ncbi:uncharacterized protein LOC142169672 [Nicotiana tabacum]|uniref:Uncharacterized protein LOC142169672 n=1 Tax=Nicotiana tabacum TaxID=4097 RepID=A0AC58SRS0_TOBAC
MSSIEEQVGATTGLGSGEHVTQINGNTMNGVNSVAGVDYNHPLFLSSADVSEIQIIFFQLTGIENYLIWHRSMRVALLGRNKLGLVDGTCLLGGIMYASSAQVVWDDLSERFNKINGTRSFNLHREIVSLNQGTSYVSVYYSRLKDMWEEFEALVPSPGCDCPKSRDYMVYLQKLKLYQFLMGLYESYAQARSQILMRSPLPTVNQAYAIIVSNESQKSMATNARILGSNPGTNAGTYDTALYTRTTGKHKKNYNLYCDYCKLKGHAKENCYKLVGYPPDFKPKMKEELILQLLNKMPSVNSGANSSVNMADIIASKLDKYTVCPCAKQTRLTFPTRSIKSSDCFDLIHMDLWGPYRIATYDGNKYFLTIVDDYSRMT